MRVDKVMEFRVDRWVAKYKAISRAKRWGVRLGAALIVMIISWALLAAFVTYQADLADAWGVTEVADQLGIVSESVCAGNCQGCYCDSIINGTCYVNGNPSGCIGCVGVCTADDNCECRGGRGGCGARLAWCRDSDCRRREPPTPTTPPIPPTPTPLPPVCNDGVEYIHIEEPAASWYYEPDYPVAIQQDPQFRGFDIVIEAGGGYAEKRRSELEQLCRSGAGTYPADCPGGAWRWSCSDVMLEHYDDPLVKIELPMRLADSTVEWIDGYLASRYYNATRQESLPRVFELWEGESMSVSTGLFNYEAQDPGVHGGKILLFTKGTPLSEPQRRAYPYEMPVFLLDSTLIE